MSRDRGISLRERALNLGGTKRQGPSHIKTIWWHPQVRSLRRRIGSPGGACGQWDPCRDASSQSWLHWPWPSSPEMTSLPTLKSISSHSFSLGWETLGSIQDRSYWYNMVSRCPAKPSSQLLEQTHHRPVSCLDSFLSRTSVPPQTHSSFFLRVE